MGASLQDFKSTLGGIATSHQYDLIRLYELELNGARYLSYFILLLFYVDLSCNLINFLF